MVPLDPADLVVLRILVHAWRANRVKDARHDVAGVEQEHDDLHHVQRAQDLGLLLVERLEAAQDSLHPEQPQHFGQPEQAERSQHPQASAVTVAVGLVIRGDDQLHPVDRQAGADVDGQPAGGVALCDDGVVNYDIVPRAFLLQGGAEVDEDAYARDPDPQECYPGPLRHIMYRDSQ